VIANGYLRLDREEWIRAVEKWRVALGGLSDLLVSRCYQHAALCQLVRSGRVTDVVART
jgi:hypothetical protein